MGGKGLYYPTQASLQMLPRGRVGEYSRVTSRYTKTQRTMLMIATSTQCRLQVRLPLQVIRRHSRLQFKDFQRDLTRMKSTLFKPLTVDV